jgi:hypothetical protein
MPAQAGTAVVTSRPSFQISTFGAGDAAGIDHRLQRAVDPRAVDRDVGAGRGRGGGAPLRPDRRLLVAVAVEPQVGPHVHGGQSSW